ncbi:MAG: hypothetical protein FWD83_09180 [Promicromonosporaceae bacterium]|nr:hypothetical protein [Promicromonosporaceae bacterium]
MKTAPITRVLAVWLAVVVRYRLVFLGLISDDQLRNEPVAVNPVVTAT